MPPPRGAAAVTVVSGPLPSGPAEPGLGLPMPSLDVPWTPPILSAGDLEALREALRGHGSVAVRLGERLQGPEWIARIEGLVGALTPGVTIEVVNGEGDESPFEQRSLPLSRAESSTGRPRYRWDGGPLSPSPGAALTLRVDDAELDPGRWRALPASTVGSCDAPMAALAAGQEQSLAELEPFLDHADAVLWQVYRAALQATVPRLADELSPFASLRTRSEFDDNGSWEQYQCGHAYWEYLQNFERCGVEASSCPSAPRVFLMGGARIGTAEPSFYVPEGCAAKVGRDYVLDLRGVAAEAAEVATEHLAPTWAALSDRLGAVTEVYEALEDLCAPRRRRFAASDLAVMRQRLAAIGEALTSDELAHPEGHWQRVAMPFHVPGLGPVQQVAEYDAGPGSASELAVAEARALRELGLSRALCRSGQPALPLAVALTDASGEVGFFGYFFEEELVCGELPPLGIEETPSIDVVGEPAPAPPL